MMKCPRCQHENPPQAKFCEECATPLGRACANCGTRLAPTAKFCPECAHPAGAPAVQPRFASPEAYTPQHLVEKILTSRSALEGERKQVTVLFADLKGSMQLLADRNPEEARKLLDPVLERMMEAVHRYEGTVNQVMGDGIMALFGAPLAHEDHAVRACYAALRMQERAARYSDEVLRSHGVPVPIRVGLNSGEVVVRSIGSDLHMDYTAVGQTTHLAARMEQIARPGSVFITADTLRLAEGYVQVTSLGPVPVKGLESPIEVFEILGAGPVRTRLQAAAARGLTRFVGRDAELDQLRQALEKARAGHGQVAALVGEPGVGKSRLFWEFTQSNRTQGWLLLESSSSSYGKATPYLPVIDVLKAYFQIEPRDDQRKIRERLTGKLLTLDEALRPTLTAFLALLDVPVEDPQWEGLDPLQRRQRTLEGVKRLFLRESQVQPLLVVFEDLHWVDSETQALLDVLVESLPTARCLLLVSYRPEYQHGWGSKTYYLQLRLDPLPAESAQELLAALLGSDPELEPLKGILIERTEGNPFFLEETVRTLVETQVLVGERGTYHLAKPLERIQVPATVQAVLSARIDRLPPEDKTLLQTAAVIGKDVPYALLQAIAELPDDTVRGGLAHLQAAEFLYETALFPELEYTFRHALTHEVTYGSLLQARRRALHARIVEAIERLHPSRLLEHVESLGYHALRAEMWEKVLTYCREAGGKFMARAAYREAVAVFERALVALEHLPERSELLEQGVDLRFKLRHSLVPLGDSKRLFEHLRNAELLARNLGDQRRLGKLFAYMAEHFWSVAEHEKATDACEHAQAIAADLGDLSLQLEANLHLGQAHHALGNYRQAIDALTQNVEFLSSAGVPTRAAMMILIFSNTNLVMSLSLIGEFAEAIRRGEKGIQFAQEISHPFALIFACYGIGIPYALRGEFEKATAPLERGLGLCQRDDLFLLPILATELGHVYAHSGRIAEALPLLDRAVALCRGTTRRTLYSHLATWLVQGYLAAARREDASRVAHEALALTRDHKERGHWAWILCLLGDIASHGDAPDAGTAEGHYRNALSLATDLGVRPLQSHCHLGLGRLYRATGKRREAQEHLSTAATLLREMRMRFWLEQAEAELNALG